MAPSPTIVTYRLSESKMVYVTPAESYEQALDFAYEVFSNELVSVARNCVSFSITVLAGGGTRTVQIGPMVWASVMKTLAQFEIINVVVRPHRSVRFEGTIDPPQYMALTNNSSASEKDSLDFTLCNSESTLLRSPRSRPSPEACHQRPPSRCAAIKWMQRLL